MTNAALRYDSYEGDRMARLVQYAQSRVIACSKAWDAARGDADFEAIYTDRLAEAVAALKAAEAKAASC